MKTAFRVDAGLAGGTGHLRRCLALARVLRERGGECLFVTGGEEDVVRHLRGRDGFETVQPRGGSSRDGISDTVKILREREPDWVVLDGYHFDSRLQEGIRNLGFRLMVIDDHAHLGRYSADLILNQNAGAESLSYDAGPGTVFLLGPRYALLDSRYRALAQTTLEIPAVARRLLVTFGGTDPGNHTPAAIEALEGVAGELHVKVVAGAGNPRLREVERRASASRHRLEVMTGVENMAELMAWSEAAVSAGGTTVWELACLGVPAVLCVVADNQEPGCRAMAGAGFPVVDLRRENRGAELAQAVGALLNDRGLRGRLSRKGKEMVDGEGAERVVIEMLSRIRVERGHRSHTVGEAAFKSFLELDEKEREMVRGWRNSREISRWMFTRHHIGPEEHARFFEALKSDEGAFYWLVSVDGVPTGVTSLRRVDKAVGRADVGIYTVRRGTGTRVMTALLRLSFVELGLETLVCEALRGNDKALGLYRRLGFEPREETARTRGGREIVTMILEKKDWQKAGGDGGERS